MMNRVEISRHWPGVMSCGLIALAAFFLGRQYSAPIMLMALLLGMANYFLADQETTRPGIEWTSRQLLRVGVALIGLRITTQDLYQLNPSIVAVTISGVFVTTVLGIALARWMGFRGFFGLLTAGSVSICGASAAMAISAAMPKHELKEKATLFTIICVSALSTLCMVAYPALAKIFEFSEIQSGVFFGATIHDVAQVVGAGYSVSEKTGDTATLVKFLRIAMLLPFILFTSWLTMRDSKKASENKQTLARPPLLPSFVLAFLVLLMLRSLVDLPAWLTQGASTTSSACLLMAMAAIGTKTRLQELASVGWKPIFLMTVETAALASWVLFWVHYAKIALA